MLRISYAALHGSRWKGYLYEFAINILVSGLIEVQGKLNDTKSNLFRF